MCSGEIAMASEEKLSHVFRGAIVPCVHRSDECMVMKDKIPTNRSDEYMVMKDKIPANRSDEYMVTKDKIPDDRSDRYMVIEDKIPADRSDGYMKDRKLGPGRARAHR